MVIALAGRRMDAADVLEKRFPAENAGRVQQTIREALVQTGATMLVCSAACGADLLALEVAGELGIRRRVVLPFDPERFKHSSVTNPVGDWGGRFDRVVLEIECSGELRIYDYDEDQDEAYFATNHDILDNAEEFAQEVGDDLRVLVVWNGESSSQDDVTAHFLQEATQRGLQVTEISTL